LYDYVDIEDPDDNRKIIFDEAEVPVLDVVDDPKKQEVENNGAYIFALP
jgi:hypothetical protein